MADESSRQKPGGNTKHLTLGQIGAGVGAAAGAVGYLVVLEVRATRPGGEATHVDYFLAGIIGAVCAMVGLAVGTLIGKRRSAGPADKSSDAAASGEGASVLARFFAVLSVLCIPVLGFGLVSGTTGLILNRKSRGWPWLLSAIGTALSAIITIIVIVVVVNVRSKK
jgi:hypothetical protein